MPKHAYIALTLFGMAFIPLNLASTFSIITPAVAAAELNPQIASKAYFIDLKDNDTVKKIFNVKFGVDGLKVAPAGTVTPGTGHFHLLIDTPPLTAAELRNPIPNDKNHIHFGQGQTQTNLTLPSGNHTLQLVMGDGVHKVHNPPIISEVITINVE